MKQVAETFSAACWKLLTICRHAAIVQPFAALLPHQRSIMGAGADPSLCASNESNDLQTE